MSKKQRNKKFKSEEVKVFKQFKKQQIFRQVSFVFAALVVAFWVNAFVLDWDFGNSLKTNVLEAWKQATNTTEQKADLYLENTNWTENNVIKLKSGKQMDNVKTLSLWIIYNPEIVKLQDIFSNINGLELSRIENEKWIATLILTFSQATHILKWKDIINFYVSKNEETTQHINIINSNFTDSTNTNYQLSTSWIAF